MIFWHAELVGWIVRGKEGIEKAVKFAPPDKTDVADFNGPNRSHWTWVPQSMSIRGEGDCELFAKNVIVSHYGLK